MLPVVMSFGLFGPMIVAAIYLIWRGRRGGDAPHLRDRRAPDLDVLIRELSSHDYGR